MKLTHDKVRALRDVQARGLHGCGCPGNCICCDWATTAVALAEEWLAARTVRWDGGVLSGAGFYGYIVFNGETWGAVESGSVAFVHGLQKAEARAWLEAKAREAGLEVLP